MCQFFSALVLKNGDVLHHPQLDSHAGLVTYFKLPDGNAHVQHFAKVELLPASDWLDVSTWVFRVDEPVLPGWWGEIANQAEASVRAIAKRMVLATGIHPLLCDGAWILCGDVAVGEIRAGARIVRVQDTATIRAVWGGTFSAVKGGAFSDVRGGALRDVRGGTFSAVKGGTFSAVKGGTFSDVRGGTFSAVWGGTFSDVWGGTFSDVRGGAFSDVRGGAFSVVPGGTFR